MKASLGRGPADEDLHTCWLAGLAGRPGIRFAGEPRTGAGRTGTSSILFFSPSLHLRLASRTFPDVLIRIGDLSRRSSVLYMTSVDTMERPLVSSMASWTTSEFDDDSKSELGGLPPTPSEVAFKIQRERANVAREGSRLQLLDYEAQRAHSESALRKAVPFKPPPPTRYESYQGILGGSNRRDAALLTLAEVLNDGVPREKKLLAPLWRATDRLERIVRILGFLSGLPLTEHAQGFEAFGIERTQSEKTKTSTLLDVGLFWLSANTTAATFASGSIGAATFGLNFRQGVPVVRRALHPGCLGKSSSRIRNQIVVVNMIAVVPAVRPSSL